MAKSYDMVLIPAAIGGGSVGYLQATSVGSLEPNVFSERTVVSILRTNNDLTFAYANPNAENFLELFSLSFNEELLPDPYVIYWAAGNVQVLFTTGPGLPGYILANETYNVQINALKEYDLSFYGTVDGFRKYHSERGHVLPPIFSDDDEVASALLVASEWIDSRFRQQFPGKKIGGREQERDWPRSNAKDIYGNDLNGVPREIEYATYEAAAIQGANPGALSVNWTPGKYKSVSIDGAVSVAYASISSVYEAQTQFAIIDEILSAILSGSGGGAPYVGEAVRW